MRPFAKRNAILGTSPCRSKAVTLSKLTIANAGLTLLCGVLAGPALAAEQRVKTSQEQALAHIEATLSMQGLQVIEQASTDRFALFYAQHEDGTHVTVTLRQLPEQNDSIDLTVATDSPTNPALERRLLQALGDMEGN